MSYILSYSQIDLITGVVLAGTIAKKFIDEIKKEVNALEKPPKLVAFLANDDPAAKQYADFTQKTSLECGFRFDTRKIDKEDLEDAIVQANEDDDVDGIMVYFPVFGDRQVLSLSVLRVDLRINIYSNVGPINAISKYSICRRQRC